MARVDRLLRFAQQAASSQALSACSDRALFESPLDFLTDGHALRVCLSPSISENKKWAPVGTHFYFHGGDGESRTRVRKHFQRTFSERS